MRGQKTRNYPLVLVAILLGAGLVSASVFVASYRFNAVTETTTTTSTTTTTIERSSPVCYITGETGPLYLRVLFDSNQTPAAGALVVATNHPFFCGSSPATDQTTLVFVTNDTEWYTVNTSLNAAYSLVVGYYGHVFNFTAPLRPVSATCATLYMPSGTTNMTVVEFPKPSPATCGG